MAKVKADLNGWEIEGECTVEQLRQLIAGVISICEFQEAVMAIGNYTGTEQHFRRHGEGCQCGMFDPEGAA